MRLPRRKFLKTASGLLVPFYVPRRLLAQSFTESGSRTQSGTRAYGVGIAGGGGGFTANAVSYNGTTQSLSAASITGLADGKAGIISFWFLLNGGDGTLMEFTRTTSNTHIRWYRETTNQIDIRGTNAAGTIILDLETSGTYLAGATWHHLIASWNLATPASHLYIDDAEVTYATHTQTNDTLNYTDGNWTCPNTNANICLAEYYFDTVFQDLTVASNRRFYDDGGSPLHPVDVSTSNSGSWASGGQPKIYLKNAAASAGTNSGTGGNLTINGGPLSDCGSHP